ncbi:MAG TPA: hypothetical protein VMF67_03535 [Rhizomicrobium sp.]|nr:hypothetical protein [Rhizomicrobium sp.]
MTIRSGRFRASRFAPAGGRPSPFRVAIEARAGCTDMTTDRSFSITKANPRAKCDSAEWIAEDNSYRLTDYGTVALGQDNTGAHECGYSCHVIVASQDCIFTEFPVR